MSLSFSKLKNKIESIFTTVRMEPDINNVGQFIQVAPTMQIFAKEFSDAYDDYCDDAETYAGDSLLTTGKNSMKSILNTLDDPNNTASIVALAIENSILAYWGSSSFVVGTPPPSFSVEFSILITPMLPGIIMSGILAGILAGGSASAQATIWATAIHTATLTVKTTHSGLDTTVPVPLPKTEANRSISWRG